MLPSILAGQLQKGIGDYIEATFPMTNVPSCFEAIHPAYLPYVHQQKAFQRLTGDDGRSTLVATGTGSGKTECFLYPILEYCYQHRGEGGIKVLIIYPMNALAADQAKRIAELIYGCGELRGNVTVGMYVGGEEHTPARMMGEYGVITDHETMLNAAPDILMTNYKNCAEAGSGQSLEDFQKGFLAYWHQRMTDEQFVSFFIAPNMMWKHAYEDMVENRRLGRDRQAQILMHEVEQRVKYEIMLEFGLAGKIGRTLEKSGCTVLAFGTQEVMEIADVVRERTVNELGVLTAESPASFQRMVIGCLNLMRTNGAFADFVFEEYTLSDGNGYMLSNDRNRWLPGRQSGRNTQRFPAQYLGGGRPSPEFDYPEANNQAVSIF